MRRNPIGRTGNFEGVYKIDNEVPGVKAGQCIECVKQGRAEKDDIFRTPEDYAAHVDAVHTISGFVPAHLKTDVTEVDENGEPLPPVSTLRKPIRRDVDER